MDYELKKRVQQVENFSKLKQDWDSYGGNPVDQYSIDSGVKILGAIYEQTNRLFQAVPTSDGGIQLEYAKDGYDIEIEITDSHTIDILMTDNTEYVNIGIDEFCSDISRYLPGLTKK